MHRILKFYGLIVSVVCCSLMALVFLAQIFQGYYLFYEYNRLIAFFEFLMSILAIFILIKIIDLELEVYFTQRLLKEINEKEV